MPRKRKGLVRLIVSMLHSDTSQISVLGQPPRYKHSKRLINRERRGERSTLDIQLDIAVF